MNITMHVTRIHHPMFYTQDPQFQKLAKKAQNFFITF